MKKFTPGPWLRDGRTIYALNERGVNRFYASVQDSHAPAYELNANAALMQSAPDLLEALEKAAAHVRPTCSDLYDVLVEVIVRARGQS